MYIRDHNKYFDNPFQGYSRGFSIPRTTII